MSSEKWLPMSSLRHRSIARIAACALVAVPAAAGLALTGTANAAATEAFACDGEAYITQEDATGGTYTLYRADQSVDPLVFAKVGPVEISPINGLGFNPTDGFIYGQNTTTAHISRLDANGGVTDLGPAAGLPKGMSAGEVSPDGHYLYLSLGLRTALYRVDLTASPLTATSIPLTGFGLPSVADFAFNPKDGKLYGADTTGQLVTIDLTAGTIVRSSVTGLLKGLFGGAWFDASGHLYEYDNAGILYKIDLNANKVIDTTNGPSSSSNDATACVNGVIGAAKQMTSATPTAPSEVTIDYVVTNLGRATPLKSLSLIDDLASVFGTPGTDWTFTSASKTSGPATVTVNAGFNGSTVTELIGAGSSLAAKQSAVLRVVINVAKAGTYTNQVEVLGTTPGGKLYGDLSTDGTNPDPNGDGAPIENDPSVLTLAPSTTPTAVPDTATTLQDTNVTVDPLANDVPAGSAFVPSTVQLKDPADGIFKASVTIPGEGVYTVDPATGKVTFNPETSFTGVATPITYQVSDGAGHTVSSTITITVTPNTVVLPTKIPGNQGDGTGGGDGSLPQTGGGALQSAWTAALLMFAGLGLVLVARRQSIRRGAHRRH